MNDYQAERLRMVEEQLRRRGIRDRRVLAAMEKIPRHRFLPDLEDPGAYADHPLPIGCGQTISQPYMVALMSECLELQGPEKVLEVGTGSGYQTAVLAELAAQVHSVERFPTLAESARQALAALGYANVHVHVGDGSLGWEQASPFDGILVTAGAPRVAQPWAEQVAEGGRLVVPIGDRFSQTLSVYTKRRGRLEHQPICGCMFVPLVGVHGWPEE